MSLYILLKIYYSECEHLKASKGFYDAAQYQDTMATTEELDKQNSYLIEKIKSGTKFCCPQ